MNLCLCYRTPFDWESIIGFLGRRTIDGVESCRDGAYERTVRLGDDAGIIRVEHAARRGSVLLSIPESLAHHDVEIAARVRRMFDVDADPAAISACLGRDALLARLDRKRPGIRVPGAWDPFELAVRAVVGQQVSVAAARSLLSRIAAKHGERLGGGAVLFPDATRLAAAELTDGMPRARLDTIARLAAGVRSGAIPLVRGDSLDATLAPWRAVRGIGEWTAGYIAMRGFSEPDAFPAADLVLRKMAGGLTARELARRAESWRPWRAYACMLLWRGE